MADKLEHTPGPWQAEQSFVFAGDETIAQCTPIDGDVLQAQANARLIAASPKLLALVIRYRNETPLGHQPSMIAHEADDAIAEATKILKLGFTKGPIIGDPQEPPDVP